jgi:molybdopterin-binding protein
MKLSARNCFSGRVISIKKGVTTANVKIEIARGAVITSSITMEALRDLKLKVGDSAMAIIKASEAEVSP